MTYKGKNANKGTLASASENILGLSDHVVGCSGDDSTTLGWKICQVDQQRLRAVVQQNLWGFEHHDRASCRDSSREEHAGQEDEHGFFSK